MFGWIKEKWENNTSGFLVVAFIGLLVFGFVAYEGVHLTCHHKFCGMCHSMNDAHATFIKSGHRPDKNKHMHNCMPCHSHPSIIGFWTAKINGLFSLYNEILDITGIKKLEYPLPAHKPVYCWGKEGCHDDTSKLKDTEFIKVNHEMHITEKKEKSCMPCHTDVVHDPKLKFKPTHKECFGCHDNKSGASRADCNLCHTNHPPLNGDLAELPSLHKDNDVNCLDCHNVEGENYSYRVQPETCTSCHDDESFGDMIKDSSPTTVENMEEENK
ncbi:MAG: NapC/NirT family cytochrome c [bacterium]